MEFILVGIYVISVITLMTQIEVNITWYSKLGLVLIAHMPITNTAIVLILLVHYLKAQYNLRVDEAECEIKKRNEEIKNVSIN